MGTVETACVHGCDVAVAGEPYMDPHCHHRIIEQAVVERSILHRHQSAFNARRRDKFFVSEQLHASVVQIRRRSITGMYGSITCMGS